MKISGSNSALAFESHDEVIAKNRGGQSSERSIRTGRDDSRPYQASSGTLDTVACTAQVISSKPDGNLDRLATVAQALQDGTYTVSADLIARAIVNELSI